MPTYEYKCKACDHRLEVVQRMSDAPLKTCPACQQDTLQRLISGGAGLIFKGSGFYITDYRSESYRKAASGDKSTAPAGAKSDGASKGDSASGSDGKSAPKAPAPTPATS